MVENEVESVAEEIVNIEEVNDEHEKIDERLDQIILEGKTSDGIMFWEAGKKTLKIPTDRVNDAIKYFKSKNSTEMNDLIKAASAWVAEQIGLKKRDYREKIKPKWKQPRLEGDIKKLRQDVHFLARDLKGGLGLKKKQIK